MNISSILVVLCLIVSCTDSPNSEESQLSQVQNLNNERNFNKTISLLEKEPSLSKDHKKELIFAYAGSAGFEAIEMKRDIEKVQAIMAEKESTLTQKIYQILEVIPPMNKKQLRNLNKAIALYELLQETGVLDNKDSRFQLGVLYLYRATHTASFIAEFSQKGITARIETKINAEDIKTLTDFFDTNLGMAIADLKKSYEQLIKSYKKIQGMAKKIDEAANFFLSDDTFNLALRKDITRLSDVSNFYINNIQSSFGDYISDLNSLAESLDLEKNFEEIFIEFKENPEKAKRVFARLEATFEILMNYVKEENEDDLLYFEHVFPQDLRDELELKIAESWLKKSTSPLNEWLRDNSSSVGKLKQFIQQILKTTKDSGVEDYIDSEIQELAKMIDQRAIERLNEGVKTFTKKARSLDKLKEELAHNEADTQEQIDDIADDLDATIEQRIDEYEEMIEEREKSGDEYRKEFIED